MHHNILTYWQSLENLPEGHEDRPSPRVCRLMTDMFERWRTKLPFLEQGTLGHLFDHLQGSELVAMKERPVSVRKARSVSLTLEHLVNPSVAQNARTFMVEADELILGVMPPYSVGQGKELMLYLTEEEALTGQIKYLNEWSPFGHVVPNHNKVATEGLLAIVAEARRSAKKAEQQGGDVAFYEAVVEGLEAVINFAGAYADEARRVAMIYPEGSPQQKSLLDAEQRLKRVPAHPAETFIEAVQSIHLMHCALHWTGETVSLGRLDQILNPFYEQDIAAEILTGEQAQEIIDCWWLKLDDPVVLNNRFMEDRFSSSDGALLGTGGASNFDQGALANQWMQQCTLGGVKATNKPETEDASNAVTLLCLNASRRMPLNSPTLDLRVHKDTPREILEAAAKCQLSGGAHPILLNDDKLIPELHENSGGYVELASARNYCCDGCYETIFPGETEFSFGYIPGLDVLEKALNSGGGFGASGGTYLRGTKDSFRTPPAHQIKDFEQFWSILTMHIGAKSHQFIAGILSAYGSKSDYCPSILLSPLINGCLESGRDLTDGGSRYHVFAPLMTGISTVADSLYSIRTFVFEQNLFTLDELVSCLRSNWGNNPDVIGLKLSASRIQEIHRICQSGEKFGTGKSDVDELAYRLIDTFVDSVTDARNHSIHKNAWIDLESRYGSEENPFEILFTPGVGTFEQYVFGGGFAGATADGRLGGSTIASDLSVSPVHDFIEPLTKDEQGNTIHVREISLTALYKSFSHPSLDRFSDGGPCDINIRENTSVADLTDALVLFAQGNGSNILTVTVADPETLAAAESSTDSDQYELVRVRMGGWTEFYKVLYPAHKAQHRRRPLVILPTGERGREQ